MHCVCALVAGKVEQTTDGKINITDAFPRLRLKSFPSPMAIPFAVAFHVTAADRAQPETEVEMQLLAPDHSVLESAQHTQVFTAEDRAGAHQPTTIWLTGVFAVTAPAPGDYMLRVTPSVTPVDVPFHVGLVVGR